MIVSDFVFIPTDYNFMRLECTRDGNLIKNAIFQIQNIGISYSLDSKKITIINSSSISRELIIEKLYSESLAYSYQFHYPVLTEKDSEGNWILEFTHRRPIMSVYQQPNGTLAKFLECEAPGKKEKQAFFALYS